MRKKHLDMVDAVHAEFDQMKASLPDELIDGAGLVHPIACGRGCHACCLIEVAVTASEILRIKAFVENLPRNASEKIKTRVRHARRAIGDKTGLDRKTSGVMCPLLADGVCTIYLVRPLTCRAWVSADAERCDHDANEPLAGTKVMYSTTLKGYSEDLFRQIVTSERRENTVGGSYELIRALHIGWQDDQFTVGFYGGKPVLAKARFVPFDWDAN
ncbi:MAG: YkgJ family cysteine cluster protein [Desulfovibrio sp.]|uniref:YkgJ family cysteine cluster protein n=1 Tax=Desulfovibrio sp. TaxID=885 RepID=UPI00135D4A08|nr:YkgJ family cysteine cluster protein [Desulfovibrio sp.]MTJ93978.1 YkgJ family cysteine cluster protein [Desulfovibrio sp.]